MDSDTLEDLESIYPQRVPRIHLIVVHRTGKHMGSFKCWIRTESTPRPKAIALEVCTCMRPADLGEVRLEFFSWKPWFEQVLPAWRVWGQ